MFEDLHWIDAETQAVLDRLVESLPTARLLLLVNYRPEYRHDWGGKTYYRQLRLDPLAPESATDAAGDPARGRRRPRAPEAAPDRADRGQPLLPRGERADPRGDGVLAGERGAYRLVKTPETVQVPATVQAILAARIDRLPPEDKDAPPDGLGRRHRRPVAVLAAVAGGVRGRAGRGLARLQAAEFLYETSLFPDVEYTFKHALTHEVAYGSLLQDRRRALHARAVEAIERLYPERLAEHVERLAHHALRGEVWEKAVAYLRQAGAKAMERSAYREAVGRPRAGARRAPAPPGESRADGAGHRPPPRRQRRPGGVGRAGEEHRACPRGRGPRRDAGRRAPAGAGPGPARDPAPGTAGDSDRALELGQRALAIATGLDDVSLQASANHSPRHGLADDGGLSTGAERLSRVVEALQGDRRYERLERRHSASVVRAGRLAWCLAELGEFAEAMARGEEAVRIAREVDHPRSLVFAYRSLGLVSLRRGDVPQAIPPLERAVELCRVTPARVLFDVTAAHLGYAYALSGRLPEGVALMEEALADPAATGTANHPLLLAYLGEAHLLAGRRDDALAVARRALDLAHRQKERGNEAWVLRLLGEIAAQADPPDAGVRRGALPPGPRPGRRARHAPARRPLPPRPRQALPADRASASRPRST